MYLIKMLILRVMMIYRMYPKGVKVAPSSKLRASRIQVKRDCLISIDQHCYIRGSLVFDKEEASISIGKRVFNQGSLIAAKRIEIGDDVLISWGVTIMDHNSHSIAFSQRADDLSKWRRGEKDWRNVAIKPVKICSKSWIGCNATILKGVTIGEGAIVGAESVVTKDVPPWTIVAGNPATVIREIQESDR